MSIDLLDIITTKKIIWCAALTVNCSMKATDLQVGFSYYTNNTAVITNRSVLGITVGIAEVTPELVS